MSAQEIVLYFLQLNIISDPSPFPFRYSAFLPSLRPLYSSDILIQHQGITGGEPIISLHRQALIPDYMAASGPSILFNSHALIGTQSL